MISSPDDANFLTVSTNSRDAVIYKLRNYDNSASSTEGIEIHDLLSPNYCHLLMLRELSNADKSLITATVARKLFTIMGQHHTAKKMDLFHQRNEYQSDLPDKVWLLIDEAHVVAPTDETSPAREALTEYVKRGRDAGLSLVMATQQPAAVDDKILSQVNLAINHRLTFQTDISAATSRLPTKSIKEMKVGGQSLKDFSDMIRLLDAGECFVSDHHTSRSIGVKIRPRVTAHGGYSPI